MRTALLIGCILLTAGGNLILKVGMNRMGPLSESSLALPAYALRTALQPAILIGLACYVLSFVMWLGLLSVAQISTVYPIFVSAAFTLVMGASVALLGEQMTLPRIIGTVTVLIGIIILARDTH